MSLGLLFWIIVLVCLILTCFFAWRPAPYGPLGSNLLLLVLIIILGVAQFGSMIK